MVESTLDGLFCFPHELEQLLGAEGKHRGTITCLVTAASPISSMARDCPTFLSSCIV